MQKHLLLTALLCSFTDAVLILIGVLGFGQVISTYLLLIEITKYFAIFFLFIYGVFSLRSACQNKALENQKGLGVQSKKKTALLLLALSLLNPHVYLDTVTLLGSIASQHPQEEKLYFSIGAIAASFVCFFSLTCGESLGVCGRHFERSLVPLFASFELDSRIN